MLTCAYEGAWVRYLIGQENGQAIYRICEITSTCSEPPCLVLCMFIFNTPEDLGPDLVKPYKIDDKTVNHAFELKHGKSVRLFNMDKVSNADFHPVGEFIYFQRTQESKRTHDRKSLIECRKSGSQRG